MTTDKLLFTVISTTMVVVLSLLIGLYLYTNSNTILNNSTQQSPELSTQVQIIYNPSAGQSYLILSLKNNGNVPIMITNINIDNCTLNQTIILEPGGTYQNVSLLPSTINIQPGISYTVIFKGITLSTHKQFYIITNAISSED